jgi:hypothetical protein
MTLLPLADRLLWDLVFLNRRPQGLVNYPHNRNLPWRRHRSSRLYHLSQQGRMYNNRNPSEARAFRILRIAHLT